ncbi:F-box/SPRY domain-containing protein 1-like [Antedon mediterranea]|uniref:F-box/SPRY domain-containing protein 1-like n=1 Tax=Antedon mediterranea TaxID=105859 RepID=UPI003AF71043
MAVSSWADLPKTCLEIIFSLLDLPDLLNVSLVCKHWHNHLNDEDSMIWRVQCLKRLAEDVLNGDFLSNVPTYKSKLRALYYTWNPNDCSQNVFVKKNGFVLHRSPVAQSTDGARGKRGFETGRHTWEIWWEGPLGTVAVVGIATKDAPMQCPGYTGLLGSNDKSWGWNLVDNFLLHNGDQQGNFPQCNNPPKYEVGERIRVILDMEDNYLAFERGYEFMGVAFRGLPNETLYPAISAVYGNTEVAMVYLGEPVDG